MSLIYPRKRQVEVLGALYAGGMGSYIGFCSTVLHTYPVRWIGLPQIPLAEVLVTATAIWALGIRINGAWWLSPFLRLFGMVIHLCIALWAVYAGGGTSASYTYAWVTLFLLVGARNAAWDCGVSWRQRWATAKFLTS